jgi:hypothetical protein
MDEQVEQLLRASRPEPDAGFVRSLESRLFEPPEPSPRRRPLLAGAALAGGLACAVLVLSLAGVGPLGGSDHPAQAGSDCKFVTVTRMEQVPTVTDNGVFSIDKRPVERRVKRCS